MSASTEGVLSDARRLHSRLKFPPSKLLLYCALCVWGWFVVALIAKNILSTENHSTFPAFSAGSACWWRQGKLYDILDCGHDYRYSPTFAVLFSAFNLLPRPVGSALWGALNALAFVLAARVFARHLALERLSPPSEGIYLLLVLAAAARGLWAAQTNPLILALVIAGALCTLRQKYWTAALLLAAPIFIKVWPIAAALLMAACWPRKLAPRLLAVSLLLAAIPFATRPASYVLGEYTAWYKGLTGPMQARHIYRDAWSIWEYFAPPVDPAQYRMLQLVSALFVLGLCLLVRHGLPRLRRAGMIEKHLLPGERDHRLLMTTLLGLWTAWQLLFGPGTERNTFCLIAPVAAFSVVFAAQSRGARTVAVAAYLLITLFSYGACERLLIDVLPSVVVAAPLGFALAGLWLTSRIPGGISLEAAPLAGRNKTRHAAHATSSGGRLERQPGTP